MKAPESTTRAMAASISARSGARSVPVSKRGTAISSAPRSARHELGWAAEDLPEPDGIFMITKHRVAAPRFFMIAKDLKAGAGCREVIA